MAGKFSAFQRTYVSLVQITLKTSQVVFRAFMPDRAIHTAAVHPPLALPGQTTHPVSWLIKPKKKKRQQRSRPLVNRDNTSLSDSFFARWPTGWHREYRNIYPSWGWARKSKVCWHVAYAALGTADSPLTILATHCMSLNLEDSFLLYCSVWHGIKLQYRASLFVRRKLEMSRCFLAPIDGVLGRPVLCCGWSSGHDLCARHGLFALKGHGAVEEEFRPKYSIRRRME
jgi:hypothetical protein